MKPVTAHPACRETVKGVLQKAMLDIADRCEGIVIIGLAKHDDHVANFLRFSSLDRQQLAYLAFVLNNYVSGDIAGRGFTEQPDSDRPS